MAAFDFDAAIRWARFSQERPLRRRDRSKLPFLHETATAGAALLLDSCVYIDQLQARAPVVLADLMELRQINHSTVAVQELMHGVGALDPAHPGTAHVIRQIRAAVTAMPPHRTLVPDAETLGRAAMLSGMLCRWQGYAKDHKLRALHDAVLFLQARKHGLTVLTRNVADFDCLLQIVRDGRALFYDR